MDRKDIVVPPVVYLINEGIDFVVAKSGKKTFLKTMYVLR